MPSISVEPCTFALFGALGDLALRKLFPALYQLDRANLLHPDTRCWPWPVSRAPRSSTWHHRSAPAPARRRRCPGRFLARLSYLHVDFLSPTTWPWPSKRRRAATDRLLRHAGGGVRRDLREPRQGRPGAHPVVLEKPIGHDLESSRKVNDAVARSSRKTAPTASTTTWAKRRCRT
jgi:glucose-6-phosphate 1-dehydrogenase